MIKSIHYYIYISFKKKKKKCMIITRGEKEKKTKKKGFLCIKIESFEINYNSEYKQLQKHT